MVCAEELGRRVSDTADALFLPTSFARGEATDVATLFPSKLAEYTAIGLPILAWTPPYSSAARWLAGHLGAAELVTDPDPTALLEPLRRLTDPAHAARVAAAGVSAGVREFSPDNVRGRFLAALTVPDTAT